MAEIQTEEPLASPVFILSGERSGSTLLRYLLDTHSLIGSPGEVALGPLCAQLSFTLTRTMAPSAQGPGEPIPPTVVRQIWHIVSGIMNSYARGRGKVIWCDKTPLNLAHARTLNSVFPDAKYICLYRNCMDVVNSCLEASRFGFMIELAQYAARCPHNLVAAMVESWIEKTTLLSMFEADNPSSCFRVRYESLVTSPERTLQALCRFLDVRWEPQIVETVFAVKHDQGGGDNKINDTKRIDPGRIGKGAAIPLAAVTPELLRRMNALHRHLGYAECVPGSKAAGLPHAKTLS